MIPVATIVLDSKTDCLPNGQFQERFPFYALKLAQQCFCCFHSLLLIGRIASCLVNQAPVHPGKHLSPPSLQSKLIYAKMQFGALYSNLNPSNIQCSTGLGNGP
jgi:hypothetical protein